MLNDRSIHVLSITEAVAHLSYCIAREEHLQGIWLEGEISNFTQTGKKGNCYFTLKDELTRISAVFFARYAQWTMIPLREGDHILAYGHMAMYEKAGKVQFIIHEIRPRGVGSLKTALQKLQDILDKEGLFTRDRKPLPLFPKCIGVITSSKGAVIWDIVTTLKHRWPISRILLFPVLVQGEQAAKSIVDNLAHLDNYPEVEVVIVGRGGGSVEDLEVFNIEEVVRAIVKAKPPVIAAIGHATNMTLSDAVADSHAVTPTAAATRVSPDIAALLQRLNSYKERFTYVFEQILYKKYQEIQTMFIRLKQCKYFENKSRDLQQKQISFAALDPYKPLERGYALLSFDDKIQAQKVDLTIGMDFFLYWRKQKVVVRVVTVEQGGLIDGR